MVGLSGLLELGFQNGSKSMHGRCFGKLRETKNTATKVNLHHGRWILRVDQEIVLHLKTGHPAHKNIDVQSTQPARAFGVVEPKSVLYFSVLAILTGSELPKPKLEACLRMTYARMCRTAKHLIFDTFDAEA